MISERFVLCFIIFTLVRSAHFICTLFQWYNSDNRALYFLFYCYMSDKRTLCFVFHVYVGDNHTLYMYYTVTLVINARSVLCLILT